MSAEKTAKSAAPKKAATAAKASGAKKPASKSVKAERVVKAVKPEVAAAVESKKVETVAPKAPKAEKTVGQGTSVLGHGVGRRKSSVARVNLKLGSGKIVVNGKSYDKYFDTEIARLAVVLPFKAVPAASRYDVFVNVVGGGLSGQADATKLGISRALLQADPDVKAVLREHGLLTVDARLKERKKFGRKAARRSFQFVKR